MATMRKGSAPTSLNNRISNNDASLGEEDQDLGNPRSLDSFIEDAYTSASNFPLQYWIIMLSLGVANSSDASEILCLNYILSDAAFESTFLENSSWRASLLAAAVFWGMLIGGLVVGFLGDLNGRRPMLLMGLACNSVAGVLSACAQDVYQLTILRAIAGLGIGATIPPLFTLVTELCPPSRRGFFVTFCASFWMVGSIYVALAALLVWEYLGLSWRVFAVLCAAPSALGALMVSVIVPESPRFLAMNGQTEKSLNNANILALKKLGYEGYAWTMQELLYHYPLRSQLHSEARQHQEHCCQTVVSNMVEFASSTALLCTSHLAPVTWPLLSVWFSLSFGSYGILTWINSIFVGVNLQNVYFNALLFALANLPGNLLSGFLMDRVGRKSMLTLSCLAAAASLMLFAWFAHTNSSHNDNEGSGNDSTNHDAYDATGIVLSACSFQAFAIAAWNTIDCMTSELFPTAVRSTGMGVCAASGRIGAMVAQFINGALVENPVRLLLVASISLVVGVITPSFLPVGGDMSQRPLQDSVAPSRRRAQSGELLSDHNVEAGSFRDNASINIPFARAKSNDPTIESARLTLT